MSPSPSSSDDPTAWPDPPSCPGSALCDPASDALASARAPSRCDYTFHTTAGDVTFRAYRALAPRGADRLYALASRGYYDGSPLYRILPGFVAQFGVAANPTLSRVYDWRNDVPGAILPDDPVHRAGPGNAKGWMSYSASYDAATGLATNRTAELFVNLVDNRDRLDAKGFAAFAELVDGEEALDAWHAGYGEMRGACDLHPEGGWVCEGPREEDLYARGAAYVASDFPNMDRVRRVTVTPNPTDHDPSWFYGTAKHHFSWSEGGAGHDAAFYAALAASAMFLFYLIRRQVRVAAATQRRGARYAPDEIVDGARGVVKAMTGAPETRSGDDGREGRGYHSRNGSLASQAEAIARGVGDRL
jgi:peptidyl-prolyl cis-trans isomerase A (cyclophilin A)